MKTSELIRRLALAIQKHGDIDVRIHYECCCHADEFEVMLNEKQRVISVNVDARDFKPECYIQ